jgi:hypothetical protein
LFLGDAEPDRVYLFVGGARPCVYSAQRNMLRVIEYD